ncbi:Benzoate 4-monooxygenase OS=Aspergillus niger GN=bphA PE=1 SV=1 [Rhizoctonia solani AG-1 IB]|uniref:Benzoate 4-monooxygenase n=1 Tax=Thanatephorus cucumeris (strain AG1-IB / isolate 7/3/14) TaxID=1108050 RepID=A0A0B7FQH9_THACB|nr:Benzoate 4-monooxygenase OS=Aspergillus niger GN=bphA PE=1 SV=1 [Rhizoctonia solani AG-1 IB]
MSHELIYQPIIQYSVAAGTILGAYYILPYLFDPYDYRHRFSGPWLASFTNWWMSSTVQGRNHSEVIRQLHDKYGTFVRIGPNHISIADPEAHEVVYGHSSGLLKTDFYHGFTRGIPNSFNTTSKAIHTTKRKRIANIFSMKSVLEFEPRVRKHVLGLCQQLDIRCDAAARGTSGVNWDVKNGKAIIDCCAQFAFLAFDIIGDLAVGSSFGLVRTQRDVVSMALSQDLTEAVGAKTAETSVSGTLKRGGIMVMTVGVYPLWAQRILRLAPWNLGGTFALGRLFQLAVAAVNDRIRREKDSFDDKEGVDIVDKLLPALRASESDMSEADFIVEVMGIIVAGGDTTSNTLSGLCYQLAIHPQYQHRLQEELDAHIPIDRSEDSLNLVTRYESVKGLPT